VSHGDVDETFTIPRVSFIIFAQSSEPVEPTKGSLTYPTLWHDLEGMKIIVPFHNLQFNAG
jgi:hypothetical protein